MSSGEIFYGSFKPQVFFLVDSTGARVVGHMFVVGDAYTQPLDGGTEVAIHEEIVAIGSRGAYKWTPTVLTTMQDETITVLIQDSTDTGIFVDNGFTIHTGGHASAYFDAGL